MIRAASIRAFLAAPWCLLLPAALAAFEDWPSWRGPRGDGTWHGPRIADAWPGADGKGLVQIWKQPIGGGYAGIAVAQNRVFTMDREPVPGAAKDADPDGYERVLCLDAAQGKLLWAHRYPVRYGDLGGYSNGPRAMPTVRDGRVYALGAVGHFHCLDAASGQVVWQKDLVGTLQARVPMWGFAASPVVERDLVIVHVGAEPGGCLIAFDRATGRERWRHGDDPAGYATPILIDAPGGRQLVAWTPERVLGLDPATGARLWSVPYKVTYGVSIATPIYREGLVFVTGYWEGSKAIRLGPGRGDALLAWEENRHLRGLMAQPLYRDGYAYSLDKREGLVCFELQSGKKHWDDGQKMTPPGRNPHASMVWLNGGDRALILNSDGFLILARLSPRGYQELGRARLLDGQVWSHPAFAGRRVYARTDGGEGAARAGPFAIVCAELAETAAPGKP